MLASGCTGDAMDEYIRIGNWTSLLCLKRFCAAVVWCFGKEYLRNPTDEDTEMLLRGVGAMGFPGMLGSIGCCKCVWKNCLIAYHVQ